MKKHTKLYYSHFNLGMDDVVYDEYEYVVNSRLVKANDIHHIEARGMGGSKTKDVIENLMALSRENHDKAESVIYTKEYLKTIHLQFMKRNPYQIWKKIDSQNNG